MWIKLKVLQLDIDIDTFLFNKELLEANPKYSYKNTGIRSEDVIDFYAIDSKKTMVKTKYDPGQIIVAEPFEEFFNKITILDYDFSIEILPEDEHVEEEEND